MHPQTQTCLHVEAPLLNKVSDAFILHNVRRRAGTLGTGGIKHYCQPLKVIDPILGVNMILIVHDSSSFQIGYVHGCQLAHVIFNGSPEGAKVCR